MNMQKIYIRSLMVYCWNKRKKRRKYWKLNLPIVVVDSLVVADVADTVEVWIVVVSTFVVVSVVVGTVVVSGMVSQSAIS